jgi:hypothetical protein
MTTMHRDRNWKIQVFGREHGVPHYSCVDTEFCRGHCD